MPHISVRQGGGSGDLRKLLHAVQPVLMLDTRQDQKMAKVLDSSHRFRASQAAKPSRAAACSCAYGGHVFDQLEAD